MRAERVAIISAVDPYPVDAGKKVVLAGIVEYLSSRFGAENVHYVLLGGTENANFPVNVHSVPLPGRGAILRTLATRTLAGRASLQEAFLDSRRTRRAIEALLADLTPDLEIYDTIRMAQYVRHPLPHQICYLDDLFSERYGAMLEAASRYDGVDIRPLGNFAVHIPRPLRPLADRPRVQRALLRAERNLVARSEKRVARRFARSLLVNATESGLLRERAGVGEDRVGDIAPLVPDRPSERRFTGGAEFVFLGLLSLPHNDDAIRAFLTETWPLVLEQEPNAKLRIIGREPGAGLVALVSQHPHSVSLEGFVPDLEATLATATAMLNTLRFGSGVKLKVIEALRAGVPVVSSEVGADGIRSGSEFGVLVVDNADAAVKTLLELCDPKYNAQVAAAARDHYARVYSREAVFAQYDRQFSAGTSRRG